LPPRARNSDLSLRARSFANEQQPGLASIEFMHARQNVVAGSLSDGGSIACDDLRVDFARTLIGQNRRSRKSTPPFGFSLFYLRREREERARGREPLEAIDVAAATSGRANG